MTVLARFRGSAEPEGLLTERELARLKGETSQEIHRPGERFPVQLYDPTFNEKLHHAAGIKAARKTRLIPVKASAATAALGYGGWGAGWLADLVVGPMGHLAATGGTAVVGAGAALALSLIGRRRGEWRRTYDAGALGATAWATATAALGPAWWLAALGAGGAVGVGTSWRRALEPRQPEPPQVVAAPEPAELPVVTPPTRVEEFAINWQRLVSGA